MEHVATSRPQVRLFLVAMGLAVLTLAVAGFIIRIWAPGFFYPEDSGIDIQLQPGWLFTIAGVPVTNTLLSSWLATLLVIAFFTAARWRARIVPHGLQNFAEQSLEFVFNFVESVVGERKAPWLFILVSTILLFVLANAWVALLPVYGPLTVELTNGTRQPLLRGAGTDINMSIALAIAAGLIAEGSGFLVLRTSYISHFFHVGNLLHGRLLLGLTDLFSGLLEAVLRCLRLVSFTFRLFSTLTAGEVLIVVVGFLSPLVLAVPFYGLELFIGLIQAWIFASLTLVFALAAMTPEEPDYSEN